MSFWEGLGKVVLGVGCVLAAPVAVGAVASVAATTGALAVTAGVATEAAVVTSGVAAMGIAEGSCITAGTAMAGKGVKEMSE